MTTEQQVKIAARMYEMRDTARKLLGDSYSSRMAKLASWIEIAAEKQDKTPLEIAITAGKHPEADEMTTLLILAAVVELTEPTKEATP